MSSVADADRSEIQALREQLKLVQTQLACCEQERNQARAYGAALEETICEQAKLHYGQIGRIADSQETFAKLETVLAGMQWEMPYNTELRDIQTHVAEIKKQIYEVPCADPSAT